jgi:hypothetical protein
MPDIRIDNTLTTENGEKVSLKPGTQVKVTVKAEPVSEWLRRAT